VVVDWLETAKQRKSKISFVFRANSKNDHNLIVPLDSRISHDLKRLPASSIVAGMTRGTIGMNSKSDHNLIISLDSRLCANDKEEMGMTKEGRGVAFRSKVERLIAS
jgi:hypothetical protein